MTTREEITNELLSIEDSGHIVLQLSTGVGKSAMSLQFIKKNVTEGDILIVIPKNVLIDNWKIEIHKFGMDDLLSRITFTTYISLHKHIGKHWGIILLDEGHHLSQRSRMSFNKMSYDYMLCLTATLSREVRDYLTYKFKDLRFVKVGIKEAIDSNILPDPIVYLLPLKLDNTRATEILVKNKGNSKAKKKIVECTYHNRWNYLKDKSIELHIKCTPLQYYVENAKTIEYLKSHCSNKQVYLYKCGERLKWLSNQKTLIVKSILSKLKNIRTLTFCNSIEQAEQLGSNAVHSKNKKSDELVRSFNEKKIKHLTAIEILTEGITLADCKVGVYACLNSSNRLTTQKLGRLLRHKSPVLVIPYYINTREEEIVKDMILDYNPELIKVINTINEIEL